jgi:hypothetical protein
MDGAISGQIAVGRYLLQVGERCGAVVHEASRAERAHIHPRPTPILLRPKLIRGLLDRRTELASALSALDASLPIEVSGEPGIGKTAILRQLAYHSRANSFVDGIVYLAARNLSSDDLLQLIFEAFNESDEPCKPTAAEIRRGLQEKQALILLDDVHLKQDELERVLDIAPQSAFAVSTRERCLWGEVRSLPLKGLPVEDAVLLLEREIERSLDATERVSAASLCAAIDGHPRRIVQAAALMRARGIPLGGWACDITSESLVTELLASTDEKQRRALLALTALGGVPLEVQHVSGIAEVTDVEASMMALVRQGLVVGSQTRHRLADGVADRLRRMEDLKPWVNRAITYFAAWAERHRRSPDIVLENSEALLRVQQCAADARRWGEVLHLGRLLEGALVLGVRWGAWAITLERCLAAAKAIGDRSAEAWALHEIGTRALCVGDSARARAVLGQAVKLRESLQDEVAAAATSRRNLRLVVASVSDDSSDRSTMPPGVVPDIDSLPLRDAVQPAAPGPKAPSVTVLALVGLLSAIVGWFAYVAIAGALSMRAADAPSAAHGIAASQLARPEEPPAAPPAPDLIATGADPPVTPSPLQAPVPDRARILIFTARPESIASTGHAGLCYAVDGALQARIDPGIGEVNPTSTLTCLRVSAIRTTTYELTASGRDGHQVKQQLVIVVR